MLQLEPAWEQLLQTWNVEPVRVRAAFTALTGAYKSPGRVYHTLDHIRSVLEYVETLRALADNLPAIAVVPTVYLPMKRYPCYVHMATLLVAC